MMPVCPWVGDTFAGGFGVFCMQIEGVFGIQFGEHAIRDTRS